MGAVRDVTGHVPLRVMSTLLPSDTGSLVRMHQRHVGRGRRSRTNDIDERGGWTHPAPDKAD
jgi:hypothetical protein